VKGDIRQGAGTAFMTADQMTPLLGYPFGRAADTYTVVVDGAERRAGIVLGTLAVMGVLLWSVAPASGGGCYTGASHTYGYGASYYYPSYYPASYTYYSPVTYTPKYQVEEVLVPKAVRAYVAPDYFSSSSDFYRDKVLADAVAGKVTDAEKLRQEIAELKAQLKAQPQQPAAQAYYQQPPPQYQMPYAAPQAYQQPQQGYQPQGGTPCDWRAQQAYQQGLAQGQQQYGPAPQQGGYGPPQGSGYQQPPQGQGNTPAQPQQPAPQPQTGPPSPAPTQPPPPPPSSGYGGGGRGTPPESNGNGASGAPQPAPRGNDAPAPLPAAGGGRPPEAEARADHGGVPDGLQAVVNEACIRCHGPKNEEMGAGFNMTDLAAVPAEGRMESYAQVLAGAMPHKSAKLPREKARLFREWFRAATQTRKVAAR
jgi:hypothetical protein